MKKSFDREKHFKVYCDLLLDEIANDEVIQKYRYKYRPLNIWHASHQIDVPMNITKNVFSSLIKRYERTFPFIKYAFFLHADGCYLSFKLI